MKSQHINFTEKAIAALPIPAKEQGQAIYYDSGSTDGLMLIVTYGGTKTYYHYMFFNRAFVKHIFDTSIRRIEFRSSF